MTTINVYLTFNGNCEEAFNFYKSVFGGDFSYVGRFKDMPAEGGKPLPEVDANRVMHISLPISKETILMGSDTGGEWAKDYKQGNNFSICVAPGSRADADRIFQALTKGGRVNMEMQDTFWGDYFGMLTDKFGINWMMSFNEKFHQQTSKPEAINQ